MPLVYLIFIHWMVIYPTAAWGPFIKSPNNFLGTESCFMFAFKINVSIKKYFENDAMKLSDELNKAKLTDL